MHAELFKEITAISKEDSLKKSGVDIMKDISDAFSGSNKLTTSEIAIKNKAKVHF